jgi:7-cyano-7-deazaguanine synthase
MSQQRKFTDVDTHETAALCVLSGGQDSTTCLYLAKKLHREVHAITFNYGQRHSVEVAAASKIAQMAGVASHEIIDVPSILKGTSPLVSDAVLEKYESAETLPGGIEKTFVPMRNALFLVIAANRASVLGCSHIYTGVSQEDFGGYPDCRLPFILSMQQTINSALGARGFGDYEGSQPEPIILATPLMRLDKQKTVELSITLPGCMDALAFSHTCYAGGEPTKVDGIVKPCGSCHACLLRAKGFDLAGVEDPVYTRLRELGAL